MGAGGRALMRPAGAGLLAMALVAPGHAQVSRDGFWNVQGRATSGIRCGDWMVRLKVEEGRLTEGYLARYRITLLAVNP